MDPFQTWPPNVRLDRNTMALDPFFTVEGRPCLARKRIWGQSYGYDAGYVYLSIYIYKYM